MANKEGSLRVWWMRNGQVTRYSVPNIEAAVGMIQGLAFSDLANSKVQMNAGGLEVYEDIGDGTGLNWNEWYDNETGESIDEYSREYYESQGFFSEVKDK